MLPTSPTSFASPGAGSPSSSDATTAIGEAGTRENATGEVPEAGPNRFALALGAELEATIAPVADAGVKSPEPAPDAGDALPPELLGGNELPIDAMPGALRAPLPPGPGAAFVGRAQPSPRSIPGASTSMADSAPVPVRTDGGASPEPVVGAGADEVRVVGAGVPGSFGRQMGDDGGGEAVRSPDPGVAATSSAPAVPRTGSAIPPPRVRPDLPLDARTPDFSDQLGDRIRWQIGAKSQLAEVRLNPPELGNLEIRVRTSDGETTIQLSVASAAAREALEAALPRLREVLDSSGIRLAQVEVNVGSERDRSGADSNQSGHASAGDRPDGADVDEDAVAPVDSGYVERRGLVDDFV